MTVKEFLKVTEKKPLFPGMPVSRPAVNCADGFSISIQYGDGFCSGEWEDGAEYGYVECRYPSRAENLLLEYAEDADTPTETVYPYVPVEIVEKVIASHGGIVMASLATVQNRKQTYRVEIKLDARYYETVEATSVDEAKEITLTKYRR